MADPVKKDDALATAVRDAFQKHMEQARLAALSPKSDAAPVLAQPAATVPSTPTMPAMPPAPGLPKARLQPPPALNDFAVRKADAEAKEKESEAVAPGAEKPRVPLIGQPKESLRKPPAQSPSRLDAALRQHQTTGQPTFMKPLSEPEKEPKTVATVEEAPIVVPAEPRVARPETASIDRTVLRTEPLRSRLGATEIKLDALLNTEPAPPVRPVESRAAASAPARETFAAKEQRSPVVAARKPSRVRPRTALYMIGAVAALALIGVATMLLLRPPVSQQTTSPSPVQPLKTTAPLDPSKAQTVVTRQVKTTPIKLDSIDMAIQEARERIAAGEVDYARLMLSGLQGTGDARVMMAMGETFDPALTHNAVAANPQLAIRFYEAAQKAGYPGAAERIGRLTAKAN